MGSAIGVRAWGIPGVLGVLGYLARMGVLGRVVRGARRAGEGGSEGFSLSCCRCRSASLLGVVGSWPGLRCAASLKARSPRGLPSFVRTVLQ